MQKTKWISFIFITSMLILSLSDQAIAYYIPFVYSSGWNNQYVYNSGTTAGLLAQGSDIKGQIGYPLTVAGPIATCRDYTTGQFYSWSGNSLITSGTLPPGLTMDSGGNISGIPTARGHWIVEIGENSVVCNGQSVSGFTQELRFHITGSGEVNE